MVWLIPSLYQGQMLFVLLTDETVFAELYTYNASASHQRAPMLEVSRQGGEAVYRQFRHHFMRVFGAAGRVPVAGIALAPEGGGLRVRHLTRVPSRLNTSLMPRKTLREGFNPVLRSTG